MKLKIKRMLISASKPTVSVLIGISLAIALVKSFPNFFERLSLLSVAAAMPTESVNYALQSFYSPKEETQITVQEIIPELEKDEPQSLPTQTTPPQNAGKISEYAYVPSKTSQKIIWYGGAAFSNTSKTSNAEILEILKQAPQISLKKDAPQVLIYHTHTTEAYESADLGYYDKNYSARSQNQNENMIRVGEEIVNVLKEAGINVIHDKTVYDYPSYNGAYNRSAETVKKYLEKYPSITITLDIHRDAIESDGARVKPTAEINGKKAAQVMIIAGVDDGTMNFPDWRKNMSFASALQRKMEESYSGLTRAVMVCHRRYNMYLTQNSLLVEVGGHANTLDEAVYSGELIGRSLVRVLKEYGTN